MQQTNQPKTIDWIVLILLGLMWGSSFLFIKKSVEVYTPIQMTLLRMTIATFIYLPFGILNWKKIDWKNWRPLVVVALCGSGLPNYFFAVAEKSVSSGVAGVLNSLVPLFTLLLGVVVFKSKVSSTKTLGILIGLAGAVFLIIYQSGAAQLDGQLTGTLLCILAAIMYAINANTIANYLRGMNPVSIGAASFLLTGVFYLVGAFKVNAFEVALKPENWQATLMVFYLAAIGTVVASIIYVWLMHRTSAIFGTSVAYLFPIVSLGLGLLDNEIIGWGHLVGTTIILVGLYLSRK